MTTPATYLVFMQRMADDTTGDSKDFIAPVRAGSRAQAISAAERHYTAPKHRVLTCFSATDMHKVLTKVQAQWPDNIADTLESDPQPVPTEPVNDAERMTQRRDEIMARLAQTRGHMAREQADNMDQMLQDAMTPAAAANMARRREPMPQPVSHPLPYASLPATAQPAFRQTVARTATPATAPVQDLKSALALLKKTGGVGGATVQHTQDAPQTLPPVTRQPQSHAQTAQAAISRRPVSEAEMQSPVLSRQPKSVIEVFKGLRK